MIQYAETRSIKRELLLRMTSSYFIHLLSRVFKTVPSTEVNTTSGVFTMTMMLGNSFGVIVATSLLVGFGRFKLNALLLTTNLNLSTNEVQKLDVLILQANLSVSHFKDFSQSFLVQGHKFQ
jgi:hypothetical protein